MAVTPRRTIRRSSGTCTTSRRWTCVPPIEPLVIDEEPDEGGLEDLYSLHRLADARPVLLIGQTGVGKAFLVQALELHACASGKAVLYTV